MRQGPTHLLAKAAFFPASIIFVFLAQQMRRRMGIHLFRLEIHPRPDGAQTTQAAPLPVPVGYPVMLTGMTRHQAFLLTEVITNPHSPTPPGGAGPPTQELNNRFVVPIGRHAGQQIEHQQHNAAHNGHQHNQNPPTGPVDIV